MKKGMLDLAIADCNELMRLSPDDAGAYYIRGCTYEKKGMIDESIRKAINQHNRNATLISMMLGFTFMALFVDGLLRVLGVIPPFLNIDINIVDQIVGKVKARI